MHIVSARCPNCGAPLDLVEHQTHAICAYCSVSFRIDSPGESAGILADPLPAQEVDRVKALVLEGRRDEAIDHYARVATLARTDAERAVDQLAFWALMRKFRRLPINAFGIASTFGVVGGFGSLGAWSALRASGSTPWWALAAACAALVALQVRWLVPRLGPTLVSRFGADGRARVLRRAVLRPMRGGTLALFAFEVQPVDGSAAFTVEEVLALGDASWARLEPGNVARVRFDEPARRRAFPVSPIEIVDGPSGGS